MGFPGGSDGKESACNAGVLGSIPELGRSPGKSIPVILPGESPWTEESGGYSLWGHRELDMTEQLSTSQGCKDSSIYGSKSM